jgi:chemosensory pili system protein ChpA (sensor histidine kinase/response regulator)
MTLRAQTQLLVFQVGREVEVNLNTIESTLDGFFRDPAKVADIAPLEALLKQVEGALSMLELEQAAALSGAVAQRVARFASGEIEGKGDAATDVAEGVSALGMYIKAVMQNAADPASLLMPVLVRLGLAEKPAAKKRLARVKLAAVPVPVPPAAPATGLGAVNVPASPAPVAAGQLSPQRRASDNAALAVHRMLHLAIDQVIGADADSLASAVDGRAGNTQSPASLSPADPVQGIHTLVLEMKAVIAARDQRIQALEAMVAKLRADARKALAQ